VTAVAFGAFFSVFCAFFVGFPVFPRPMSLPCAPSPPRVSAGPFGGSPHRRSLVTEWGQARSSGESAEGGRPVAARRSPIPVHCSLVTVHRSLVARPGRSRAHPVWRPDG
jgi:hypothetical protein